jgi:uncharacterized LabA/DUF88 family protein
MAQMSSETAGEPLRVIALVDGFNLYHALDWYDRGFDFAEKTRYRKYKWLCLTALIQHFVDAPVEHLVQVEYFTTYPHWDPPKEFRHKRYVMAQQANGVIPRFGEFKEKTTKCKKCKEEFPEWEEKQTDVNIATRIIELTNADAFDKLILVTADSDQVPALKLAKKMRPRKRFTSLVPIGRGCNEIYRVCEPNYTMTEDQLGASQLPELVRWQKVGIVIKKPDEYA